MVSMKMEKDAAQKLYGEPTLGMPEMEYPYGLKICLDEASIQKLGLQEMPQIGAKMKIEAIVEVCAVSKYDTKESGQQRKIDLQITDMEIEKGEVEESKPVQAQGQPPISPNAFYGGPEYRG